MPTSRASPSIALPRITESNPASRATLAAASRDFCGVATRLFATFAKRGSPGFGVSETSAFRCIATMAGISMPYFVITASASARVDTSGTVGPDAIMERSSPGTSEIASVTYSRRRGGDGETTAFDRGQVFSNRVHFGDMRAAFQQRAVDGLLVG